MSEAPKFKRGLLSNEAVNESSVIEQTESQSDGILRINLEKAGGGNYTITGRFLPNLQKDGKLGKNQVIRTFHYVNIEKGSKLNGYYDCPKNFDKSERSPLGSIQYNIKNSTNALIKEREKQISWNTKNYAHFLVYNDKFNQANNGKVFILSYGKQVVDKISDEDKGENQLGEKVNVFSLTHGKDFRYVIFEKEVIENGKTRKYPDYTKSSFSESTSPAKLPKFTKDDDGNEVMKLVSLKLEDSGELTEASEELFFNFMMESPLDMRKFEPQRLTEEQIQKIEEIGNILLNTKPSNNADASDLFADDDDDEVISNDDFNFEDDDVVAEDEQVTEVKVETKPKAEAKPKAKVEAKVAVEESPIVADDDDDFDF